MNPLWSYFSPALGLGLVIGILAGVIGFRLPRSSSEDAGLPRELRRRRIIALVAGALL